MVRGTDTSHMLKEPTHSSTTDTHMRSVAVSPLSQEAGPHRPFARKVPYVQHEPDSVGLCELCLSEECSQNFLKSLLHKESKGWDAYG